MGKNLTGIDVLKDKTNLITRLYPRGAGSAPSESTLSNPLFYPVAQWLTPYTTDSQWAYFRLPKINGFECAVYDGYTGAGQALPSGFGVGKGKWNEFNLPYDNSSPVGHSTTLGAVTTDKTAVAQLFHVPYPFNIYSVSFFIRRQTPHPTTWPKPPIFSVGLYTCQVNPTTTNIQLGGYATPNQGPIEWCYSNLLSIPWDPIWVEFPMQATRHLPGWYAFVIAPYSPTDSWNKVNPGTAVNDYLSILGSADRSGSSSLWTCSMQQTLTGVTQPAWRMPVSSAGAPFTQQCAFMLNVWDSDVTSQFVQSDDAHPGRQIKCPIGSFDPTMNYFFNYRHAPYLQAWDAYDAYGKYEGSYKDDSLFTQTALMQAGAQYLYAYSEPTMTISLGAVDLYEIDPNKNWDDELKIGKTIKIIDQDLGLEQECVITKIVKMDMTQPHKIDTLEMENVHLTTQQYLAQIGAAANKTRKYLQGDTVESIHSGGGDATVGNFVETFFELRADTDLTHSVKVTTAALSPAFQINVDGNPVY